MGYDALLNKEATFWRKKVGTGQAIEDWEYKGTIRCMIVSLTPQEKTTNEFMNLNIDYKIYIQSNNNIENGDKLVYNGQSFLIKKVDDIAMMGKVFECWATKI